MKRDSRPKNEGRVHFFNNGTRFRYEHMLRRSRSLEDSADSRKIFREIGKLGNLEIGGLNFGLFLI